MTCFFAAPEFVPITPGGLVHAQDRGEILPADVGGVLHGQKGLVSWTIARVQKRLLLDLAENEFQVPPAVSVQKALREDWADFWAQITHSFCVLETNLFGEMTSPKARTRKWADMKPGTRLVISRIPSLSCDEADAITTACRKTTEARVNYPEGELLSYWIWSWSLRKLALGQKAADVFSSRSRSVCSGSVVEWIQAADIMRFDRPEFWYPGRLSMGYPALEPVRYYQLIDAGK